MFGFGKKKELVVDDSLYAPLAGQVIPIEEVSDPVFSKKIMGDGFAVEPDGNKIYAPVTARVELVQGHALGFVRADGLEVLLHVGIDTVSLKGAPFNFKVKVGDIVDGGDEVGTVDWAQVEAAGLMKTTMVVFTNSNEKLARFDIAKGQTTAATKLGTAAVK
ncbi:MULTISPECIES: glucose PTS transporter subunit IIA [unclassified Lactococcus]|uniref:PTS sugar transporter subunit IIA n=1 Tax=unclassified Lactococcus TaxID=2643510 RepID=UPI0011CA4B3B|nr:MULTISPECIES: glucose PTS transporter subunit IIA [unclassified Lactococcus]MQW23357.1 PTS glucose transporter subunit IIA [Lactococcus sp. dk101]TXK37942.1 PTS glucose transporter subunit IIA [Lactococcus sp. dk310]TXK49596.1 PTS glucose transporter subunit IIA [Lactococcus sp. dk322]